jgi:mRNA interferase MazF
MTRRGDLVLAALPGDYGKPRPVLTVQADIVIEAGFGSLLVCPLTTALSGTTLCRVTVEPSAATGLRARSEIMVEKLTAVPERRLRETLGRVDALTMRAVERALLLVLGIGARHDPAG